MLIGFKAGNRYRLGDHLTVRIDKVDLQDRQLYLQVVKNHSASTKDPRDKTSGSGKKSKYQTKRKTERRGKKKRKRS